jgi:hypothetical protein
MMTDEPTGLSAELAAHYREVLQVHGSDSVTGVCPICQLDRCPDWLNAYDTLAAANLPMGEPSLWTPPPPPSGRRKR